ncbi:hypothetical protein ND486_15635 [Pseudonocardia sp. DR1-2]|uniref:hypothetical protein n=1 Tax=Pseudonocardia sp. DR1-2 TaxID=2951168 RepID=UPI002043FAD8|nr:hypothetical protein [Pseudonocardia sp. DR1-2]MCM3847627.1 hypothetical protein [Pseudonocardia sp. DR1-2]
MTFDLQGRVAGATTAELRTAAALRWQRPLLTAELAEQACARAVADGDDLRWLQAAGWLLDGHAAGGDARDVATAVVAGVTGRVTPGDSTVPVPLRAPGTEVLTRPEGARLRVELAGVAQADGELEAARALVVGLPDDAPGEDPGLLRLDRLAVEVRCALAGASAAELERLRSDVDACGSGFGGEPAAYADLVVGSVHRARREHDAAVDRALRGLAQLGWTPERPGSRPLSTHLAAALLSQWITALLDSGYVPPDAVAAAAVQRDAEDAGRQGVLLRLTLARVQAGRADHAARALVEAADGAEEAGVPALVAACRTAQSELHEGSGRYREALETMRAAMEADQVDRDRGTRFRAAVAALLPLAAVRTSTTERPTPFPRTGGSPAVPAATGGTVAGAPTGGPGAGDRDGSGRSTPETGFATSRSGSGESSSGADQRDGDAPPAGTPVEEREVGAGTDRPAGLERPAGTGDTGLDRERPTDDRPADDLLTATGSRNGRSDGAGAGAGDDRPAGPGDDGATGVGAPNGRPANDLPAPGRFPVRWAPSESLLLDPGTRNGAGTADPSPDDRTVGRSTGAHRNGHRPGEAALAADASSATGTPGRTDTAGTPDSANAAGSADRAPDDTTDAGGRRPAGIDPADPLGVSGLLADGPAPTAPRDPSWTGPSWTPDAAGGSPLADALLAEWRAPEPPAATHRIGSHGPTAAVPRNGARHDAAHRPGDGHGAGPAGGPGPVDGHRNGAPAPEPAVAAERAATEPAAVAERAATEPAAVAERAAGEPTAVAGRAAGEPNPAEADPRSDRASARAAARVGDSGPAAAPTAPAAPTGPPGTAERSIVLDLVDGDLETVTGTAAVGALHDVVTRARRLVPPSGTTRRDDDTVRVTLPDVDHVTVLLWARSLATHLGGRVRRGGLPAGTSLRMQAVGPHGVEGDEIVTELTGPDTPAPLPEGPSARAGGQSGAAQTGDAGSGAGEPAAAPEPVAGPALATPLDLSGERAARGGRRRAAGDGTASLTAVGLTVRPGSGGRRRSDGALRDPAARDRTVRHRAAHDSGARERDPGHPAAPHPSARDKARDEARDETRDEVGSDPAGPVRDESSRVWGGSAPADPTPVPDPLDTRFALPPEPDRRLAEAVRAHLDLPGPDGAASRLDGPARERSGLPVRWSGVDDGAGESALPRRRGRDATPPADDGDGGAAGLFDGGGTTSAGGHRASGEPDGSGVGAGTWTVRTATGPTVVRGAAAVVAPATGDAAAGGDAAMSRDVAATGDAAAGGDAAVSGDAAAGGDDEPSTGAVPTPTTDLRPAGNRPDAGGRAPDAGTATRRARSRRAVPADGPVPSDTATRGDGPATRDEPPTSPRDDAPAATRDGASPVTPGRQDSAADAPGTTPSPADGTPAAAAPSDPAGIPEDMGLADLLAGALAAYREI